MENGECRVHGDRQTTSNSNMANQSQTEKNSESTSQPMGWGEDRAKPLFFGQTLGPKFFGQKPAAKNEKYIFVFI